jgi:hypothetical protein
MANLKYTPVKHDHQAFLAKARARKGFTEAYDGLELEYRVADQLLKARARAGLTQDAVAERMGTTTAVQDSCPLVGSPEDLCGCWTGRDAFEGTCPLCMLSQSREL